MSRRSSFGYSSYGSRSYRSGGYHGKRNRKNKRKKIIIITLIVLILAAAAALCLYFFVFGGNKPAEEKTESTPQTSQQSRQESAPQSSQQSEVSKQESSEQESSKEPDLEGSFDGNVFVYDKQGYELFYGSEDSAKKYAAVVSSIKKAVGKDVNVYNLVAPNHAAFGLPEKYLNTMSDEKENIDTIYASYSEDVKTVDAYAGELAHKGDYIYFKTDSNWTGLGAYYGYQAFCKTAGLKAVDLTSLSSGSIKNFTGSLLNATKTDSNPKGNKELLANKDTVVYYNMKNIESCKLLENGQTAEKEVPLIATFAEGSNAYSAFIWGDNPYMKVKTTLKTGKKLCIIKDSYGCAFAPFTTANYDEVFIVDPRYYEGNVIDYIKKNKFTDVLVINNVMSANTEIRLKEIKSIIE